MVHDVTAEAYHDAAGYVLTLATALLDGDLDMQRAVITAQRGADGTALVFAAIGLMLVAAQEEPQDPRAWITSKRERQRQIAAGET